MGLWTFCIGHWTSTNKQRKTFRTGKEQQSLCNSSSCHQIIMYSVESIQKLILCYFHICSLFRFNMLDFTEWFETYAMCMPETVYLLFLFFTHFFLFSAIIQCAIQNQIMPLIITFIRCKSVFWHAHDFRIVQFHLFICFDHVSIFKMILSHFRISSLSNCFQIWNKLFRISFKMRCNLNEENL